MALAAAAASVLTQQVWAAAPAMAARQQMDPLLLQAFQDAMAATTYEVKGSCMHGTY